MPRSSAGISCSFADVYDALYEDAAFLQAQMAFLGSVFGPPPLALLDLGCGTGAHLVALSRLGHRVVGLDVDLKMLRHARSSLAAAQVIRADLRRIPFRRAFEGALCLESPLAYLLDDVGLCTALAGIRSALRDDARLVIDVYDYPGTLGASPVDAQESHFEREEMRVKVVESHRYEPKRGMWTMRQQFEVEGPEGTGSFEAVHQLRIRTMDEYAQALEAAGFTILEALAAYPNTPQRLRDERRLILVARR